MRGTSDSGRKDRSCKGRKCQRKMILTKLDKRNKMAKIKKREKQSRRKNSSNVCGNRKKCKKIQKGFRQLKKRKLKSGKHYARNGKAKKLKHRKNYQWKRFEKCISQACPANFIEFAQKHQTKNENRKRQTRRISDWLKLMDRKKNDANTTFASATNALDIAVTKGQQCLPEANETLKFITECPGQVKTDCRIDDLGLTVTEIEECSKKDGSGILDQYGADGGDLQVCKFC